MRKVTNKKDKAILTKLDTKMRDHFKEYADVNGKSMSEIVREHIISDLKKYEQTGKKKQNKVTISSKESAKREMAMLYHATNILNTLEGMNITDKSIEREVKALWDIVV